MKKKIALLAGLGFAQSVVLAQTKPTDSVTTLKDVVITSTKNNQKQSQTGKVATILGPEVLDKSLGKTLPQLLAEQAGITVTGATSNYAANKSVFFRGAGSAYAIVLIDGIVQNDPSGNGGAFDLRLLPIDQIERIEILRGGQSTIYGSDAVGGVINIITKKGAKQPLNVYGVASAGSYETYKGTIGLQGNVSNFDYNISYTHVKSDGISEAVNPVGNTTAFDKDGLKTDGVNAKFGFKFNDNFSINPFVRYNTGTYNYDDGPFTDAANYSILKNIAVGTNAVYLLGKGKVTLNYSHQKTSNDVHSAYPALLEGQVNFLDVYYNQQLGKKLDLLLGVDHRDMKLPSAAGSPKTNILAGYGSLFLHDLSIFNLEVGGRYNKHEQYGENWTYTITPSINLVKQVKLFGNISTGFKIPTLTMLFGTFGANLNLKPEKSENYEAGVEFNFADGKYKLRGAAYKRNLTGAIIYNYPQGYENQISQKTKGFEIEPAVKLGAFSLNGFYSYTEGDEYNFVDNAVADYLFRRPKHTYGATAGLQATKDLFVSLNYRFVGSRTDGDFNSYPAAVVNLPSYKLLNAYAEYSLAKSRVKLFVDTQNILNEKYNEIYGYNSQGFNVNAGVRFNIY
ncbi:TonB-dependent receptor plug domain-containing protein [Pedobacter sp. SL55]|uniref:TonB-dependent receptor plug domain-containing protein n=1 Tax=Pedobacter sp. SL55 TaxID=2995161 RepID=UPI0022718FE1|nr:TonB-dependent receptor [Pedobacter sp. SL55]WAC39583.1 TonB-dependent receptor [Pedobacter sp. SL55]